jgi:hypothetical protein
MAGNPGGAREPSAKFRCVGLRGHAAACCRVVDAVRPLPVVAVGGIGDGRGPAAVLVFGGAGVRVGSRFIASYESEFQPLYEQRIVAAAETEPLHTDVFDAEWKKAPHRVLVNSTVQGRLDAGSLEGESRPGAGEIIAWTPERACRARSSGARPLRLTYLQRRLVERRVIRAPAARSRAVRARCDPLSRALASERDGWRRDAILAQTCR